MPTLLSKGLQWFWREKMLNCFKESMNYRCVHCFAVSSSADVTHSYVALSTEGHGWMHTDIVRSAVNLLTPSAVKMTAPMPWFSLVTSTTNSTTCKCSTECRVWASFVKNLSSATSTTAESHGPEIGPKSEFSIGRAFWCPSRRVKIVEKYVASAGWMLLRKS